MLNNQFEKEVFTCYGLRLWHGINGLLLLVVVHVGLLVVLAGHHCHVLLVVALLFLVIVGESG